MFDKRNFKQWLKWRRNYSRLVNALVNELVIIIFLNFLWWHLILEIINVTQAQFQKKK